MAPRGLRSKLTNYGDPAFSLFLRKAFIKAAGYSDDALDRPIVGIANTHSDYNPCHGNVPQLIEAAKRGVMLTGALPMVFPTISIHESFANPTSMYLRNLMAIDTEEMIRAQPMDAVILIGGCDKTLPAQLMAGASSEVPAIYLPTGPMSLGHYGGETLGACTDCRRYWGMFRAGEMDQAEIDAVNDHLVSSIGTCAVMGTASTMACLVEAMGLCLPMAGSAPAVEAERMRLAEETGRVAARLAARGGPIVREILTPDAIHNALVMLQALGGSTNAVVHLAAIAGRLGGKLDMRLLDELGRRIPVLVDLKPSGAHYLEHFHKAGGVPRLMKALGGEIRAHAATVYGRTIGEIIDAVVEDPRQTIIATPANPVKRMGAIAVLYGNLAPAGAVIKQSAASPALSRHQGRAVVFDSLEDLSSRIDDETLDVRADDILVLRNAGPKGAPGMPEAGYLPIPRKLARQGVKDMVRISDARMSGTAFGTIVLHITPEAAVGGPLAIVRSGDVIRLDLDERTLGLMIDQAEFDARMRALEHDPNKWMPVLGKDHAQTDNVERDDDSRRNHLARTSSGSLAGLRGYARLYQERVLQADGGADFDFLTGGSN
jgi:dihydroxy-acid dehydratase